MPTKTLLIDVGNTQCKSRTITFDEKGNGQLSDLCLSDNPQKLINESKDMERIFLASVKSDAFNAQLKDYAASLNLELVIVETEKSNFDLTNSYEKVSKMGVDRWLAMLGAQLFADDTYIVLDAGTAITCDAVSNGKHIGGWIAPGYSLLRDSVTSNTQRVNSAENKVANLQWGNDTEDCLHFGCIAQIRGLLLCAKSLIDSLAPEYKIIVSGGDAELFRETQHESGEMPLQFVDNIVLYGLLRYALPKLSLQELRKIAAKPHF